MKYALFTAPVVYSQPDRRPWDGPFFYPSMLGAQVASAYHQSIGQLTIVAYYDEGQWTYENGRVLVVSGGASPTVPVKIGPHTKLSELQRIVKNAPPDPMPYQRMARSVAQSMRAEGYNVTERDARKAAKRVLQTNCGRCGGSLDFDDEDSCECPA